MQADHGPEMIRCLSNPLSQPRGCTPLTKAFFPFSQLKNIGPGALFPNGDSR